MIQDVRLVYGSKKTREIVIYVIGLLPDAFWMTAGLFFQ